MLKKAQKQGNTNSERFDGGTETTKSIPKMPKERRLEMIEKIGIKEFEQSSNADD